MPGWNGSARRGGCDRHGHDFAAERAQPDPMRLTLLASAVTCALLAASAAYAQSAPDGPVATAGSTAGGVPTETGPAEVRQTPSSPAPQSLNLGDFETAAEQGRRAPLLGEYHGEVGAVVGTNGLRGAYGHINAHPSDNVTLDLRFSTLHGNGLLYGPPVYGPGLYAPGPYGPEPRVRLDRDPLSPDAMDPLTAPPPPGR
jgi:hypothetical protein